MNRKSLKPATIGFTLIELLAVIVILAIIALIATPIVLNIIEDSKKRAFLQTGNGIINAAEYYYFNKMSDGIKPKENKIFTFNGSTSNIEGLEFDGEDPKEGSVIINTEGKVAIAITNGEYCITKGYEDKELEILNSVENCVIPVRITDVILSNNYFELSKGSSEMLTVTVEPQNATNQNFEWIVSDKSVLSIQDGMITAISEGIATITLKTTDKSNIERKIDVVVGYPYKNGIMSSKNNCINEGICKPGTEVKADVNESTTHKFYVISDVNDKLTLIMDRNIVKQIEWVTQEDYEKTEGGIWQVHETYAGNTDKGPITLLNKLNEVTKDWTNIPEYNYTLIDDKPDYYGSTVMYQPIEVENARARLPMYSELASTEIGCNINNNSCPEFLYDNSMATGYASVYGYWLSTAYNVSHPFRAWLLVYQGKIAAAEFKNVNIGIRPVIELSK